MSLTNTWETKLGNALLRAQSVTFPTVVYVGLFKSDPGEAGSTSQEVSGGAYARQAITFAAPTTDGVFTNSGQITFPTATASWGTVSHIGIMTAATGGEMIASDPVLDPSNVATTKTIGAGDSISIADGALTVTFS